MRRNPSRSRHTGIHRLKGVLALGATTVVLSLPALAQGINVFVDGNPVNFSGVPPVSQGGRVLVPLRGVFEALGAFVDFNKATNTIIATRGETRLQLTIGSRTAFINGNPVTLDVPASTQAGRTLVPLRFVGEAMGAKVDYNAMTRDIAITSGGTAPTPTPEPTPEPTPATPEPEPEPEPQPAEEIVSGSVVKVDTNQPATITIRTNNRNRTYELSRDAVVERKPLLSGGNTNNPRYGSITRLELAAIQTGESVEVTLDDANRVRRLTAMPQVHVAKVRSVTGGRIVLDDARGTVINIGNQVRFLNARGRETATPRLRAGDEVVLFVSPDTRVIYQVSAYRQDVDAANSRPIDDAYIPPQGDDDDDDDDDDEPTNNAGRPEITQVNHNAREALRAGATINVTVKGTPGMRGTFDLSNRAVNLPLQERRNRPGEYFGDYTIRRGDDVTAGRVTARLTTPNGEEITQQSVDDVTIDTIAPKVTDTDPRDRDQLDVAQPNITIEADDLGGSGLAPSTISITNGGQTFDVPATVTRRGLRAVSPRALSGRVDVTAEIRDEAGNVTTEAFSFTVRGDTELGAIRSIYHNANRALQTGDVITVDMTADEGGRATFDLVDENNRTVVQGVAMTEIKRGQYRGTYTITNRDTGMLKVVGRFRDVENKLTIRDANTSVEVLGGGELNAPEITTPVENDKVGTEVTVRGRALAGSTVEVAIRAEGVQYLVLNYARELGSAQTRVNKNGTWEIQFTNLPRPKNVSNLRYVIRATQMDSANRTSEETTVTVRPQ